MDCAGRFRGVSIKTFPRATDVIILFIIRANSFDPQRVSAPSSFVCPESWSHNGYSPADGIFSQARLFREDGLTYEIIDSRGPWFLGTSPLHTIFAGFYLVGTLVKLLTMCRRAMRCIVYVNHRAR